ncbi:hypothetical protein [Leptospira santarosai]|uniref:hypothetical protein n=1 Tax=Leptospira santarosai TaxID=28183 RepID=UPI0007748CE1|nr:hypothetical protein [Leptospira santarosai]MDI7198021.1 hypothetical protein [Leptospira santarosai]MDI7204420.1 hypothetical protein [Leptospira santarosai]
MESLTYDELRELNYLVRYKTEEIQERIVDTRMVLSFESISYSQKEEFEKIENYYIGELNAFEAIKSKLDLMEAATRHD